MQRDIARSLDVPAENDRVLTKASEAARSAAPNESGQLDFVITPRYLLGGALEYYKELARPKNIFDLLTEDHEKVKSLLSKVKMTDEGSGEIRDELFAAIKEDLEIHARFEEQVFYPKARTATGLEDMIEDGLDEHSEAKALLDKLEAMSSSAKEWLSTIQRLREAVEHHTMDEEAKLFPTARNVIDEADAEAMAEEYVKIKRAVG